VYRGRRVRLSQEVRRAARTHANIRGPRTERFNILPRTTYSCTPTTHTTCTPGPPQLPLLQRVAEPVEHSDEARVNASVEVRVAESEEHRGGEEGVAARLVHRTDAFHLRGARSGHATSTSSARAQTREQPPRAPSARVRLCVSVGVCMCGLARTLRSSASLLRPPFSESTVTISIFTSYLQRPKSNQKHIKTTACGT
jgi:hypothetical protein